MAARKRPQPQGADRLVDIYAETILCGEWKLNGEPLILDYNGVLQSGQHRLLAVLSAGKSIRTLVVRGADPEALYSIDSGRRRRMTDVLTLKGEKDTANLAAALSWLWRLWTGQALHLGNSPSNTQLLKLLDENPDIRESLAWGRATKKMLHFSVGLMAALQYLMWEIDGEDFDNFFLGIAT